jgi:hypothetical protein
MQIEACGRRCRWQDAGCQDLLSSPSGLLGSRQLGVGASSPQLRLDTLSGMTLRLRVEGTILFGGTMMSAAGKGPVGMAIC